MLIALTQIVLVLVSTSFVVAADDGLKPEYVNLDLAGAARVAGLVPLESLTYDGATRILPISTEQDLGFGGRLFTLGKGGGYTLIYLEGFAFKGRLGKIKVGVRGYRPHWPILRDRVMNAWREAGGPDYRCSSDECFFESADGAIIQEYRNAVTAQLGKLTESAGPDALQAHYDYLLSPFEVTYVGPTGCGYPPSPLRGREAIDALLSSKRYDLITNVLKSYNPGGRVYALMALQKAVQRGVKLPPDTQSTMNKVLRLPVRVSTCIGCIVNSGMTAEDVVAYFR